MISLPISKGCEKFASACRFPAKYLRDMKIFILLLSVSALVFTSCNTAIGLGRDFRQLGNGLENTGQGKQWNTDPNRTQSAPGAYGQPAAPAY